MNKSASLFISFLLLFLIMSCKKTDNGKIRLSGTITEEGSTTSVANAKIEFREYYYDNNSLKAVSKIVQTLLTDASGSYRIDFVWKGPEYWYNLNVITSQCETNIEGYDISKNSSARIQRDISLLPYARLRLHIKGNKGNSQLNVSTDTPKYFWNQGADETIDLMCYGNTNNILYYNIENNASRTLHCHTYFVKAHETYSYTIEF